MSTFNDAYNVALSEAKRLGAERGKALTSWYDVNDDNAATILRGIEEGDPAVLDTFPFVDLSGEWADEPSGPQVLNELSDAANIERDDEGFIEAGDDLLNAYEDAAWSAIQSTIEERARYYAAETA